MRQKRVIIGKFVYTLTALSTGRTLSILKDIEDIKNGAEIDYKFIVVSAIKDSFIKVHTDLKDGFVESIEESLLVSLFNDVLELSGLEKSEKSGGEPVDWLEVYSHLIACTGWTPRMIDEQTTLYEIVALNEYYAKHPPMHILHAAHVGFEYKPPKVQTIDDFIANNSDKIRPKISEE